MEHHNKSRLFDINEAISVLSNMQLVAVKFILSYVILEFEPEGNLSVLVWPSIVRDRETLYFRDKGYRDVLCSFIGNAVLRAYAPDETAIELQFEDGRKLVISISEDTPGGEHIILTASDHFLFVV